MWLQGFEHFHYVTTDRWTDSHSDYSADPRALRMDERTDSHSDYSADTWVMQTW